MKKTVIALFLVLTLLFGAVSLAEGGYGVSEEAPASAETLPEQYPDDGNPVKAAKYTEAVKALERGSYVDALNTLASLGKYRNAVRYTTYAQAMRDLARGNLETAIRDFTSLGAFIDSAYRADLCRELQAHRWYTNGKFGYVDQNGCVIIEPQYDWADRVFDPSSLSSGKLNPVARVFNGTTAITLTDIEPREGKWGLLRRDGTLAVPVECDEILWVSSGIAAVRMNGAAVIWDLDNNKKLNETFSDIGTCSEGWIPVKKDEKWGFVDREGIWLGEGAVWDSVLPFSEGFAGVTKDKKAGFINDEGKVVILPQYQDVKSFGCGLAAFRQNKRWGFIDRDGVIVIKPTYNDTGVFSENACPVKKDGAWGLIDPYGARILSFKYSEITDFDPVYHRAWVRKNKLWGLINPRGDVILTPTWATYTEFGAEGLSLVSYRGKHGFIDVNGAARVPASASNGAAFGSGLGCLQVSTDSVQYVNKLGRGFTVKSTVPTQLLNGFIEGRKTGVRTETAVDENGRETVTNYNIIHYCLYRADGTQLTDWQ